MLDGDGHVGAHARKVGSGYIFVVSFAGSEALVSGIAERLRVLCGVEAEVYPTGSIWAIKYGNASDCIKVVRFLWDGDTRCLERKRVSAMELVDLAIATAERKDRVVEIKEACAEALRTKGEISSKSIAAAFGEKLERVESIAHRLRVELKETQTKEVA